MRRGPSTTLGSARAAKKTENDRRLKTAIVADAPFIIMMAAAAGPGPESTTARADDALLLLPLLSRVPAAVEDARVPGGLAPPGRKAVRSAPSKGAPTAGPSIFPTASAVTCTPLMVPTRPGNLDAALLVAAKDAVEAVPEAALPMETSSTHTAVPTAGWIASAMRVSGTVQAYTIAQVSSEERSAKRTPKWRMNLCARHGTDEIDGQVKAQRRRRESTEGAAQSRGDGSNRGAVHRLRDALAGMEQGSVYAGLCSPSHGLQYPWQHHQRRECQRHAQLLLVQGEAAGATRGGEPEWNDIKHAEQQKAGGRAHQRHQGNRMRAQHGAQRAGALLRRWRRWIVPWRSARS